MLFCFKIVSFVKLSLSHIVFFLFQSSQQGQEEHLLCILSLSATPMELGCVLLTSNPTLIIYTTLVF